MTSTFGTLILGDTQGPWVLVFLAVVCALTGMIGHWLKKSYKKEIHSSLLQYFFVTNVRATIFATLGMLAGLFAAFAPLDYTSISTYQVITQSFTIGYAANSALNSEDETKP